MKTVPRWATALIAIAAASLVALAATLVANGNDASPRTATARVSPTTAPATTTRDPAFPNALNVPPLLAPRTDDQGRKVFDLTVQQGTSHFLPGTSTQTWGVNGAYLGPTLRASQGDRVLIHVHNRLPGVTTMHWHGMHLPAVDDGGPHQPIAPGATWSPTWTIDQQAATLWYHPHPDGETADQVYRGVAGLF
jgi:FtsP/CotA-like multicopper oxidase with cupredoxin domain